MEGQIKELDISYTIIDLREWTFQNFDFFYENKISKPNIFLAKFFADLTFWHEALKGPDVNSVKIVNFRIKEEIFKNLGKSKNTEEAQTTKNPKVQWNTFIFWQLTSYEFQLKKWNKHIVTTVLRYITLMKKWKGRRVEKIQKML